MNIYEHLGTPPPKIIEPTLISDTYLSSLCYNISGENIEFKRDCDKYQHYPMWVSLNNLTTIYYNSNLNINVYSIYHEYGHIKTIPDCNNDLVYAEVLADKYAIKLCIKNDDIETTLYGIARTFIYNTVGDICGSLLHYNASQLLQKDVEYLTICEKIGVNLDAFKESSIHLRNMYMKAYRQS